MDAILLSEGLPNHSLVVDRVRRIEKIPWLTYDEHDPLEVNEAVHKSLMENADFREMQRTAITQTEQRFVKDFLAYQSGIKGVLC